MVVQTRSQSSPPDDSTLRSDMSELKTGDFISGLVVARRMEAAHFDGGDGYVVEQIDLENNSTRLYRSHTSILNNQYYSTHPRETVSVARTVMIGVLEAARDAVVEVVFHKKVTPHQAQHMLKGIRQCDVGTTPRRMKLVKRILEGERRVIRGIVTSTDRGWARTKIIDLDLFVKNPDAGRAAAERQVDHRSLVQVTYKNTRYKCCR